MTNEGTVQTQAQFDPWGGADSPMSAMSAGVYGPVVPKSGNRLWWPWK